MNCDGCLNLVNKDCSLKKHDILGAFYDDDKNVVNLINDCIFKNTQHKVDYKTSHAFAMTRIAIDAYYIINDDDDEKELYELLEAEEKYGENALGRFNVILRTELNLERIRTIALKLNEHNKQRLWKLHYILDNQTVDDFILENSNLPFFVQLIEASDFAEIQNFKHYCFSHKVPNIYGNIMSIDLLRKQKEEEDARVQAQSPVQFDI